MNTNIFVPKVAWMLSSVTEVKASFMITNRTVAMTEATVMKRAAKKVKMAVKKATQREKTAKGLRKIMTKARQAPDRNKPNIQ